MYNICLSLQTIKRFIIDLIYKYIKHIWYPCDYNLTRNVGVIHHCVACQHKYEYLAESKLVLKNSVIQNCKSLLFLSKDIL